MQLREWRQRQKLTLTAMGRLIGRNHATVLRLERGDTLPDPSTLKRIFDATNGEVSLHDFFAADGTSKVIAAE